MSNIRSGPSEPSGPRQLTFQFPRPSGKTFATFVADRNAEVIDRLASAANGASATHGQAHHGSVVMVGGDEGTGKSHLLQACVAAVPAGRAAVYLDLAEVPPAMTEGLSSCVVVAVDRLDAVAGDDEWERALFGLYNDVLAQGGTLVAAARVRPGDLGLALPDLRSRLQAADFYRLQPLSDTGRAQLLEALADRVGLPLPAPVTQLILRRWRRDADSLVRLLRQLDQIAWQLKRPLTVPLVSAEMQRLQRELEPARHDQGRAAARSDQSPRSRGPETHQGALRDDGRRSSEATVPEASAAAERPGRDGPQA